MDSIEWYNYKNMSKNPRKYWIKHKNKISLIFLLYNILVMLLFYLVLFLFLEFYRLVLVARLSGSIPPFSF